jgi:hypothetical protein
MLALGGTESLLLQLNREIMQKTGLFRANTLDRVFTTNRRNVQSCTVKLSRASTLVSKPSLTVGRKTAQPGVLSFVNV